MSPAPTLSHPASSARPRGRGVRARLWLRRTGAVLAVAGAVLIPVGCWAKAGQVVTGWQADLDAVEDGQ